MFLLNKFIWAVMNPLAIGVLIALAAFVLLAVGFRRRILWPVRLGFWLVLVCVAWFWLWSTQWMVNTLGVALEREYPLVAAKDSPKADAIVILGGGMCYVEGFADPTMSQAADRVWHAARLYRAGKAPLIITSGTNDVFSTVPLLLDFGVPRQAILCDESSRNTYENARFTAQLMAKRKKQDATVLLVTSAWHMHRALGNFSKTSLRVIPAATDHEASMAAVSAPFQNYFLPSPDRLFQASVYFKEYLGRLAAK